MKLVIKNGMRLVFSGDSRQDSQWQPFESLVIKDGLIQSIDDPSQLANSDHDIDAQGGKVIPGLIDLSVSLPEPGYATKGTIESETRAAVKGGVTTLCCIPETDPVNDSPAVTKLILETAHAKTKCNVLPLGALTQGLKGENLAEYAALKEAGCVALSNAYNPLTNLSITKRCFQYAKTHGLSVFLNPIEPSLHRGVMHSGEVSTTIGLPGIASVAETIAVAQLITLAESTGVHLHLSQLSAADSVRQLRDAKARGVKVTADVAVQNLLFTDEKVENFNSMYRCLPPLRAESDRKALIEGVIDGTIDAISSAHRPHEAAAKQAPFAETEPGMSNIELLMPMAGILSASGELPLAVFVDAMTRGAAKVLQGVKPELAVGAKADLCILDDKSTWCVEAESLVSTGKNTPLLGQTVGAKVSATIIEGEIAFSVNA